MKNIDYNSEKLKNATICYKLFNTVTENGSIKRGITEEFDGKLLKITESKVEKTKWQIYSIST